MKNENQKLNPFKDTNTLAFCGWSLLMGACTAAGALAVKIGYEYVSDKIKGGQS